mmetsp:Transcript_135655/g.338432  ORF Transcript_135655/g.338432 Transcript_135655/m.338432 type:complete len:202 (-) Transcript_135655:726-1331(-)
MVLGGLLALLREFTRGPHRQPTDIRPFAEHEPHHPSGARGYVRGPRQRDTRPPFRGLPGHVRHLGSCGAYWGICRQIPFQTVLALLVLVARICLRALVPLGLGRRLLDEVGRVRFRWRHRGAHNRGLFCARQPLCRWQQARAHVKGLAAQRAFRGPRHGSSLVRLAGFQQRLCAVHGRRRGARLGELGDCSLNGPLHLDHD